MYDNTMKENYLTSARHEWSVSFVHILKHHMAVKNTTFRFVYKLQGKRIHFKRNKVERLWHYIWQGQSGKDKCIKTSWYDSKNIIAYTTLSFTTFPHSKKRTRELSTI